MKLSADDLRQRLLPILLGQAVGLVCGTIGVKLSSRLVAPDDYGMYGVFLSLVPLGSSVIYIGLVKFVQRHWQQSPDRPGLLRELFRAVAWRMPLLAGAAALAVAITAPAGAWTFGLLLVASALLAGIVALSQAALQAMRAHWRDFGLSTGLSVTRSFLPPLCYAASALASGALLLGFLAHAAAGALLGLLSLRPWWRRQPGSASAPPQLAGHYAGAQFMVLAVAGWIVIGMNRWLVAWFHGHEVAGYFTLAGNIGILLPTMLGGLFLQFCQPLWFARGGFDASARHDLLRQGDRAALGYTGLSIAVLVALHFLLPFLVGPLIDERYRPAAGFVLGTGTFALGTTLAVFYHTLLLAAQREADCVRADLAGVVCYVAGSVGSAAVSLDAFKVWLLLSPLVPLVVNRTIVRSVLRREDGA